jgi:hypothetical protein
MTPTPAPTLTATPTNTPTPTATATETLLPSLDIDNAGVATCGSTIQGDTHTGANNVSSYACQPWAAEPGPEVVYRIVLGHTQQLRASFVTTAADLDLFLLPSGNPAECLAAGDNALAYEPLPGTYYLAVDGYQGAAGNFAVQVSCPPDPQATATPTLTPPPAPAVTLTVMPASTPGRSPTQTSPPTSTGLNPGSQPNPDQPSDFNRHEHRDRQALTHSLELLPVAVPQSAATNADADTLGNPDKYAGEHANLHPHADAHVYSDR